MDSFEQLKITGTGFDVKAGVIFRPVKDSPFRIGAYFNSPIFYDLTVSGDNDITISGIIILLPMRKKMEVSSLVMSRVVGDRV